MGDRGGGANQDFALGAREAKTATAQDQAECMNLFFWGERRQK